MSQRVELIHTPTAELHQLQKDYEANNPSRAYRVAHCTKAQQLALQEFKGEEWFCIRHMYEPVMDYKE